MPMDFLTATVLLAAFIGAWYSLATALGRRANAGAARRCGACKTIRYLATGTSYLVEMECEWAKYVGVFVQRLPWDNPLNLAASLLARRKPLTIVKVDLETGLPWWLDMSSRGALGSAERVGRCYVVGRAAPKSLIAELADACERLGAARLIIGGRPALQIYIPSDDCGRAIQISRTIIEILGKYVRK